MGGHSSATPLIWIPGSSLCVPSSTHTTHSQLLSTVHRSWHSCALRTLAERTKKAVPFGLNDWMNQLNKRRHELVGEWVRELKWNDGVQPPGPTLGRKRCLGKCLHPRNDCRSHTSNWWKHLAGLMRDVTCWNGNNQPYTLCKLRNIDL